MNSASRKTLRGGSKVGLFLLFVALIPGILFLQPGESHAQTGVLESGSVTAGGDYVTVNLDNAYASPVVVCSVQYDNNTTPVVVRVSNVTPTSFDVRLQNPSGGAVAAERVSYVVVEEGTWTIDGVSVEAQTYLSTVTDEDGSWVGEVQSYGQSYTSPVVLGQVMSENDPDWSAFWCQGGSRTDPPSSAALTTGKMVGEDTDTTRADETIGFIVFEAGHGTINGVEYEAFVGADTVQGVTDTPPYLYSFSTAFATVPQVVVTTMAGVDGYNGGWAQTHGSTLVTTTSLYLSIDEDLVGDSERDHTTEQVGYVAFGRSDNSLPVADDQAVSTDEDTPVEITLTGSDVDGDELTFEIIDGPTNGVLSGSGAMRTYTPDADYDDLDSFTFRANDGLADSNLATVSITVNAVNDPPVADDQAASTDEDTSVEITLTATDVDGDALTYEVVDGPTNGVLTGTVPGVTYTPDAGYTGLDSFTFRVNDGTADSNLATVTINITEFNNPPVAEDQAVSIDEDTAVDITLIGSDGDGDALTFDVVDSPTNGVLSGSGANRTYTPGADYDGADSFTFRANDGQADSNLATVSITVDPVNDPPVADDQAVSTTEDTPVEITLTAYDVDGDALTYELVSSPTNGVLSGSGATRAYTPDAGYTGADSFTFRANDGTADSSLATVTVTVSPATATGQLEAGSVMVGGDYVTVNLDNAYLSPVVVCSVQYDNNTTPVVVRVSNVAPASFDVRLQNPSGGAVAAERVSYVVVEEGTWTIDGVSVEAQTYLSTVTDENNSWVGEAQSYGQSYTSPVVLGQVMSENDPDWSAFWCQGGSRTDPPSATALTTGKMVGEDTDTTRADETIGFIVFEAGHGTINGVEYEAFVGADTVQGVTDTPPYLYSFSTAFATVPQVVVTTMAGVDGNNGGWAQTHGSTLATTTSLYLSIDEDQVGDSERDHTTEQVGYVAFGRSDNSLPVADDQAVGTDEDTPVEITLTGSDVDGDELTFEIIDGPTNGVLSGSGAMRTYTPNAGYIGPDSFTFRVNDGTADSNLATVTISIAEINDPPVAEDQAVSTNEDTPVGITLTGSDEDGDALTFEVVDGPTNGTLTGTAPDVTYTPNAGYTGPDSFTFRANDGQADSNLATVNITVNDAPVADDQTVSTDEATPVVIVLTASDVDGDALTYSVVDGPANGTLTGTAPEVTYTPGAGYSGADSFTFRANDGLADSNLGTVSINVIPVTGEIWVQTTVADFAGCGIPNGASVTNVAGGEVRLPALVEDYFDQPTVDTTRWTESLRPVTIAGGILTVEGGSSIRSLASVNDGDLPVAVEGRVRFVEPGVGTGWADIGLGKASEIPGPPNALFISDDASNVYANDYQPGTSSPQRTEIPGFDWAEYQDMRLVLYSDRVEYYVNGTLQVIHSLDTAMTMPMYLWFYSDFGGYEFAADWMRLARYPANDEYISCPVDVGRAVNWGNLTWQGDVPSGTTVSFETRSSEDGESYTDWAALEVGNAIASPGGRYLQYRISLSTGEAILSPQIDEVTITVNPNNAPVAEDQAVGTDEDTPVDITLSGSDEDGDALTFEVVDGPTNGVLSDSGANLTYTPDADYEGADSFTFRANDGLADSDLGTVSITVDPVNDAPVAEDQAVSTDEDTPVAIVLTASDVDGDALTYSVVGGPTNGTLTGTAPDVTYTPDAGYGGADSFTFRANDGQADSNLATVSITVDTNYAPVADDQAVSMDEDTPVAIVLTASDVDGDALTYSVVGGPTNGTLTGTAPEVTYTPDADYDGTDSFTFRANDGLADSNLATVSITVDPVNDAPVADDQAVSTDEDTSVDITLAASDVDGDALTFEVVDGPTNGVLSGSGATRTYTPDAGFTGTDSFTFRANDGTADSSLATVTIEVSEVNNPPVADDQAVGTDEDTPVDITLTGSDGDGDTLTFEVVDGVTNGVLSGSGANLTYTPNADYDGTDSFTFRANDGQADSGTATVSITVAAANDAPVADDQDVSTTADTPVDITLTGSDVDGDALTFEVVDGPTNGALSGSGATRTYTPNAGYTGTDSFTFRANDGQADSNVATVSISVAGGNYALSFDGSNDIVRADLVTAPGPLTIEAWVRPDENNANGLMIVGTDDVNGWSLEINYGQLTLWLSTSQGWQNAQHSTALQAGQWVHVAATYENGTARVFVDGVASTATSVGTLTQGPSLSIGGFGNYPFFDGTIDEVRISNVVRYTSDFVPSSIPFSSDANTLGLWHFDEGAGQFTSDVSTLANEGTLGDTDSVDSADPNWVEGYPW